MRRSFVVFAAVAASLALASPALAQDGGAVVFKDFACGTGPGGFTNDSQAVVTPSGNATLVCRSEGPPPPETVRTDVLCNTQGGFTSGRIVYTKSGQVILVCHVHPKGP